MLLTTDKAVIATGIRNSRMRALANIPQMGDIQGLDSHRESINTQQTEIKLSNAEQPARTMNEYCVSHKRSVVFEQSSAESGSGGQEFLERRPICRCGEILLILRRRLR